MHRVLASILAVVTLSCSVVNTVSAATETAVFAGGCFWGVEAVFEHVSGVIDVRSGYSGGDAKTAKYEIVSEGRSGHAESVKIVFDPQKVTFTQLLSVFFVIAHDSTQVDRQGPDVGPQYRSVIFYLSEDQKKAAAEYIEHIDRSKVLGQPVATKVVPFTVFYEAEDYHQDFVKKHPRHEYVVYHDLPKIRELKNRFPKLYKEN